MNKTTGAVIALAVILAIAGYLFYASAPGTDTAVENQMTAPAPAGEAPATPPAAPAQ